MIETVPVDLRAAGHLAALPSLLFVAVTSVALVAVAVIGAILARRWNARAERTAMLAKAPADLTDGWAVLAGEIEDDEIDAPAVQVDIEQTRVEKRRVVVWRETKRSVRARPFALKLDDGRRVRIEPGDRVFAIAPLNVTRAVRADERLRAATIRAGKRVVVTGVLARGFDPSQPGLGYRDAGTGLVLTPPPRGSMLVSTDSIEALVANQRDRARVHRRELWLALTALVLGHALMLWRYDVLLVAGEPARMVVVDGRTQLAERGDHWQTRYILRAQHGVLETHVDEGTAAASDDRWALAPINIAESTRVVGVGGVTEAEVDAATYYRTLYERRPPSEPDWRTPMMPPLEHYRDDGMRDQMLRAEYDVNSPRGPIAVWWRFALDGKVHEIGEGATVYAGSAIALALLAGVLMLTYAFVARSARPWWERKRIEDRVVV